MPLLGKRVYNNVKPLTDIKEGETVYTIAHTKEQFRSKEDYERRLALYKDRIWTCQCTGHINLAHEEAFNSERVVLKTLKSTFAECYEKPTLELVHHSTASLDSLVDQAWLKIQQCLCLHENVVLKVKNAGKVIGGKVIKTDTCGLRANPTSNCSSPSSDKENKEENGKKSPKKWVPPKLLPYKYTIKLEEDDKIINEVPASDLVRTDKPPAKDCLRLFIRAHAVRAGVTATDPWLVEENLVKKYTIPSKFNDFLISPSKMAEAARKAEEEIWKRKKKSAAKLAAKKLNRLKKSKDNKNQLKLTGSPLKKKNIPSKHKSPKKANGVIELCSESDSDSDDCVLADLKGAKSCDSDDSDAPLSAIKSLSTPKKSKSNTPNKKTSLKKNQSMKQVTLYQLAHKPQKTPTKSSQKTPEKKKKSDMPDFVAKMVKAFAEKDKARMEFYLLHAVKNLTPTQRMKLPDSVRDKVKEKYDQLEEKKKIAKMSPEEREAYMRNKKNEEKRRKRLEVAKRFEDQDLNSKPLPAPKLVPTPDGLPNEMFGDVAMVTEFISTFSGLLMPDEEYPIYTDALMKALSAGRAGFTYLSRVLTVLLQTLLQDPIAEDYTEVKVKLTDIPVTQYTASELLRLCLRKQDVDDGASGDSLNSDEEEFEVSDDVVQLLETQELYELDPVQKLQLLKALCLRIMGSYSVQDYMEEKQRDASSLWRRKIAQFKERKDKKKLEKENGEKPTEENNSKKGIKSENPEKASNMEITHFYGKTEAQQSADEKTEDSTDKKEGEDDDDNLASRIKNRRILSAKAAKEKAEKEKEKRIQLEKELAIQRKQKEQDSFEKEFNDGIALAKLVYRQTHIGTDRNHSRYWIFNETTPGLLIEKGWITRHIDYSTRSADAVDSTEDSMSETDTESVADSELSTAKKLPTIDHVEKTVPHLGQNLWFTYDSLKDVDKLLENLHPNGIRECALKTEIKKKYADISKAIIKAQRANHELRDSNGDKEMMNGFREELMETELRLRNGGLGGVPDFPLWDTKRSTSEEVSLLAECLLETQKHVLDKFLYGIMKPPKPQIREEEKDDEEEEDEDVVSLGVIRWRDAVENCQTISRLSVMLGILDSCVKWEKSAENAKCKICRKKCNEDSLLLCDECNQAFHCYCLRPAVIKIPVGEWFCPACIPESQKRVRHPRYTFSDEDEEDEEEIEHDDQCWECEGTEDLIVCGKCPSAYHIECHNPPLKYSPRGYWECSDCKAGRKRRKKPRKKVKKELPAKRVKEESSSEDEEVAFSSRRKAKASVKDRKKITTSQSSSEDEEKPAQSGRSLKNLRKVRKRKRYSSSGEESDEECPPSKSARRSKQQTARTRTSNQNGDLDYEVGYKCSRRAPSELSVCEELITRLMKHRASWPFIERVDKKQVPDYYDIIKKPMTFQTIKQKLARLSYSAPQDVIADVALTFNNAEDYNKVDSEIYDCISVVEKYFIDLLKKMLPQYTYSREQIMIEFFSSPHTSSRRTKKV